MPSASVDHWRPAANRFQLEMACDLLLCDDLRRARRDDLLNPREVRLGDLASLHENLEQRVVLHALPSWIHLDLKHHIAAGEGGGIGFVAQAANSFRSASSAST